MDRRKELGDAGEAVAAQYLSSLGMEILDRNWRCRGVGELDLVARDGDWLVVCEVKTRSGTAFGDPLESVTAAKHTRLRRLAAAWLGEHDVRPAGVRIDLIGVLHRTGQKPVLRHVRAVGQ
ncbi:YraN family protein [Kribbia dieselivorans]|uniref:YraN family protein n=1 Tax=Kribbia dieselivorans TaxID=331526 RepID=UPI000839AD57|nr:YraN family protein [Kribbia dieselivorans]